ncbi:MAG: methyltransferase [Pseudomonadota bacterium]|nr:methyltransferase [Pseudomonadota bacterium]
MNETLDAISGLGVVLRQKRAGHRIGLDAVLLAAAAGPAAEGIVDVGAGVGAVGLALARRLPQARLDLVEIDAETAALAADNAARNGLAERVRVAVCDVTSPAARRAAGLVDGAADLVVTNPPFYDPATTRVSPDPARARAHALSGADPLAVWLKASLALLAPGGRFAMIHRPDALPAIYAALAGRLGDVAVRPVYPRAGADAIRLLLTGVKGSRAPARFAAPLTLHEADGSATAAAREIHEGRASLWP